MSFARQAVCENLPLKAHHKMKTMRWLQIAAATFFLVHATVRGEALSLKDYLQEVRKENHGYQSAVEKREGSKERGSQADLLYSPALFANVNFRFDKKLPQLPFFQYTELDTHQFAIGVQKQTSFGLTAKLSYQWDFTNYLGASLPPTASGPALLKFWDARPIVELNQSLWQNGFGSGTRATERLLTAQSEAETFASEAERKGTELMAEIAYWRLAAAREVVKQNEAAISASGQLFKYITEKASSNLTDKADVLQSKAALETRRLDLKTAKDEVRAAMRQFNALRNAPTNQLVDALEPLNWSEISQLEIPENRSVRPDVKAAQAQLKMSEANAVMLGEKDKPQLDLYASWALNGRDAEVGQSTWNAYQAGRPTVGAGIKFLMPLDLGATSDSRRGASRMERAAQLGLAQKQYDEKQQWEDLTEKLTDAKERFHLAEIMESAQEEKLTYERQRLKQGRTTTYQQLLIEQEYTLSGLVKVRAAFEALQVRAQMKLYEEVTP